MSKKFQKQVSNKSNDNSKSLLKMWLHSISNAKVVAKFNFEARNNCLSNYCSMFCRCCKKAETVQQKGEPVAENSKVRSN